MSNFEKGVTSKSMTPKIGHFEKGSLLKMGNFEIDHFETRLLRISVISETNLRQLRHLSVFEVAHFSM